MRLTETISKSFAVSGKSAAESAGAIRQLGQAFAAGNLRGDEFNSIAEGAPEIMRALQRSLKLTQGELREFAATGGITSEILVTALGGAAEVIDEKLSKSTRTLAQSFQEAENNAIGFIGASDLVTTSIGNVGDSIVFLSNNLDKIANILLVAAIIGVSKLSASLVLNTVETVKNTVAKTASVSVTSAIVGVTGKQIVTTTHLTAAQRAATIAATGLNRAMGFLGGPLGVVLTAASAIAIFATNSDDAKASANGLTKEVNAMVDGFSNLNKSQVDAQLGNAVAQVDALKESIKGLKASSNFKLGATKEWMEVAKLNTQLEEAIKLRDALFQAGLSAGRTTTDQSDAVENRGGSSVVAGDDKPKDKAVNIEAFKTANLREELMARLEIQKLHNNLMLQEFSSLADEERAINEFNKQADLIDLESNRTMQLNDFALRREQLLINTQLDADAKSELITQIEAQELLAKAGFEADKLAIEDDAKAKSVAIARDEARLKDQIFNRSANDILNGVANLGKNSIKIQKAVALAQAAISIQVGIARAQELGFPANIAEMIRVAAVGVGVFSSIKGASVGSGGGGASVSSGGSTPAPQQAQRQEPIERLNVVENRGLSEVANALANLDPGEVLPVEFTQRIVASLEQNERLGGGG